MHHHIEPRVETRSVVVLAHERCDAVERGVRMSKLIDDVAADLPEDDGPVDDDTD